MHHVIATMTKSMLIAVALMPTQLPTKYFMAHIYSYFSNNNNWEQISAVTDIYPIYNMQVKTISGASL